MESLLYDLKFGIKLLKKEKGFTITALLTLAVCIGANTAIFSVINSILFSPLPFPESNRVVLVYNSYPGANIPRASAAVPDYYDRREKIEAFEGVALHQGSRGYTLGEPGSPFREMGMEVTPSFFTLLKARPLEGRLFIEEDGEFGSERKVILSYGLWRELYGGDESVIGQEMRINSATYIIMGIMPEDFRFLDDEPRLWLPLAFTDDQKSDDSRHSNQYQMIARLKPGATLEQARSQLVALNTANEEIYPLELRQLIIDTGFFTEVLYLRDDLVRDIRPRLWMLWGGVLFVLLIGCVNIANLLLVRSNGRMKELATRFAVGAGQGRMARQLLTESVLLAVIGGVLGLLVGTWGLNLLTVLGADQLPRGSEIGMDPTVVLFTFGLAVVAGILFGTIPVVNVLRSDLATIIRSEGRTGTAGRKEIILRGSLVVAQVSLAIMLLVGAGLTFVSFRNVISVDPGFEPEGVLTGAVLPVGERYPDNAALLNFSDQLLERIGAIPGVEEAGLTNIVPFAGDESASAIFPEGYVREEGESILAPYRTIVSPGYFRAMGIPVLRGRTFEESDTEGSLRVAVIDEWLARRFWPDTDPIGKRYSFDIEVTDEAAFTIIGIVGEIKQNDLADTAPLGANYLTYKQNPLRFMILTIKTPLEPYSLLDGVRKVLSDMDPDLPVFWVQTMEERIADSMVNRRAPMLLLMIFAAVALLLAAIGLYGVLAYTVTQRSREIGIRLALGSGADRIFRMVVWQGLLFFLIGLPIGIGGAIGLTAVIRSQLFEAQAFTPAVFVLVCLVLGLVALLACILPARRATMVDPVATLNYQ